MITTVSTAYMVYSALPAETQDAIKAKFTSEEYTSLSTENQKMIEAKFFAMLEGAKDAGTSASSDILKGVSALFEEKANKSVAQAQSTFGWLLSYVPFGKTAVPTPAPSIEADDFEFVPLVSDEERLKIRESAERLFNSTNTEQKVYSQDELNQPFQLRDFGAHNPYLRRAESVDGTTNSYQSLLTIHLIHKYLGHPARKTSMCLLLPVVYHDDFREVERAALQHLESRIRENDPVALQVAVVLSQLVGKDSSCLPRVSEDLKDAVASLETAKVTPYEQGRIVFTRYPANMSIEFTIVGDVIFVAGADGEEIVAFETHRTVNVGYPAEDGSVTCTTTTFCQNVHVPSVK